MKITYLYIFSYKKGNLTGPRSLVVKEPRLGARHHEFEPCHSGFNMVSVWPPGPFSPVPVGRGEIVGLSERSGYLDYQKKKKETLL